MAGNFNIRGGGNWRAALQRLAVKTKVKAGILETATTTESDKVAQYAAYNEYGTSEIPSRPFMRETLARCRDEWVNNVKNGIMAGMDPQDALIAIGARMRDDIQATIKSDMPPPNSKEWAEYKNRHEQATYGLTGWGTLIHVGAMFGSVNWQLGDD